ncbi:MAG TPA: hypothetical protein VMW63_02205 [Methanoregulaceae archaeon]|nr:hypothetical protein [Methanoregulaceae archaeon]
MVYCRPATLTVTLYEPKSHEIVLCPGWNFVPTPRRLSAGNNTVDDPFGDKTLPHIQSIRMMPIRPCGT